MFEGLIPNRQEAGKLLTWKLSQFARQKNTIVLALPRGGVPVGFVIAKILKLPLDIYLVRKLGAPHNPELALGAIALPQVLITNPDLISKLGISGDQLEDIIAQQREELERRNRVYRGDRPLVNLHNQRVIIVDDGVATGSTILAVLQGIRQQEPKAVVVATPIISRKVCEELKPLVDQLVYLFTPEPFYAISRWYQNFEQLGDEEVCALLQEAWLSQSKEDSQKGPDSHSN